MNRLKKGDQVYIISGKDKGKTGTVNRLTQDDKVLVDGINPVSYTHLTLPTIYSV